jgi:transcriptional regulator with XRE-family HTH domain
MVRLQYLISDYTKGIVPAVDGPELRRLRKRARLTQAALAVHLGVAPNTVARWKRNERAITEPMGRLIAMTLATTRRPKRGAP